MYVLSLASEADASLWQEIETEGFDCGGTLERNSPTRGAERQRGLGSVSLFRVVSIEPR
jgi:hypothetical protein